MRLKMAMDIARAVNFLHTRSPPMIHRDLKSANVLVPTPILSPHVRRTLSAFQLDMSGPEPVCRVADFGSCVAEFRIRRRVVDNPVWYGASLSGAGWRVRVV